jgi:hypothetical protein
MVDLEFGQDWLARPYPLPLAPTFGREPLDPRMRLEILLTCRKTKCH